MNTDDIAPVARNLGYKLVISEQTMVAVPEWCDAIAKAIAEGQVKDGMGDFNRGNESPKPNAKNLVFFGRPRGEKVSEADLVCRDALRILRKKGIV